MPRIPAVTLASGRHRRSLITDVMRLCALATCAVRALLLAALFAGTVMADDATEFLGPGDTVKVTVFQNPDLTIETRVSARGTISFPLIGEVKVGGLTPSAAEARIAEQLRAGKFILSPQVNLAVLQVRSRQVAVLGQVNRPGKYPLEDASSKVTDLISVAGGVSPAGADSATLITSRGGKTEKIDIDLAAMARTGNLANNLEVLGGDIVYVQRAPVFYIYGEVQRAGAFRLEPNMTVMQALSLGGGITTRGTQKGLKLNRQIGGKVRSIDVNLEDLIQADDVIYVRESLI